MKKLQLILFFVLPFTIYSQLTLKDNYYKKENLISLSSSNDLWSGSDNMLMKLSSDSVVKSVSLDSTLSRFQISVGASLFLLMIYPLPSPTIEISKNLTEQTIFSVQFATVIILNDLSASVIYKPTKSSSFYYGVIVHRVGFSESEGSIIYLSGRFGWLKGDRWRLGLDIQPGLVVGEARMFPFAIFGVYASIILK